MVAPVVPAVENTFVGLRKTVCFDLRGSARSVGKISVSEWMTFLKVDVGIDLCQVEQSLLHTITGGLFVEMSTEEEYKELLNKAEAGVAWSKQGGIMVYGWCAGVEVTSLHLNNVFSNSDMDAIRLELSKYGDVVAEQRQYYKDCPTMKTGVVTVKMKLSPKAVVPTYLMEQGVGNTVQVFSEKHSKLCHRCLEHGHLTAWCRKPVKSRQAASKTKTWAMVASTVVPGVSTGSSETSPKDSTVLVVEEKAPSKVPTASTVTAQSIVHAQSTEPAQSPGPVQSTVQADVSEVSDASDDSPVGNHRGFLEQERMLKEMHAEADSKLLETEISSSQIVAENIEKDERILESAKMDYKPDGQSKKRIARSLSPKKKKEQEEKKSRMMSRIKQN